MVPPEALVKLIFPDPLPVPSPWPLIVKIGPLLVNPLEPSVPALLTVVVPPLLLRTTGW
jgi:hypothetical protein